MERNVQLRRELLAEVEAVAPTLAEHAADSEGVARLNAPSIEALRQTRLLRFICPKERGGDEADPITHLEIIEALAKIDGSAAWNVGILAGTSMIVAAFLPPASGKKIFASGVPPMAGMLAPRGRAEPVDGGYRVGGRWSFGSGIHHADWVVASPAVPGEPFPAAVRVVVLPRNQVVIHDNWQVAGLKASGSCDYSIDDVFVPEEMAFRFTDMVSGAAVAGGAALKVGSPALIMPIHFAIALGVARRALDEVTAQAIEKESRPSAFTACHASAVSVRTREGRARARVGARIGNRCHVGRVGTSGDGIGTAARHAGRGASRGQLRYRGGAARDDRCVSIRGRRCTFRYQSAATLLPRCLCGGTTLHDESEFLSGARPVQAQSARRKSHAVEASGRLRRSDIAPANGRNRRSAAGGWRYGAWAKMPLFRHCRQDREQRGGVESGHSLWGAVDAAAPGMAIADIFCTRQKLIHVAPVALRCVSAISRLCMADPIEINRQNWDERATIHARDTTGDYMLDRFRAGEDALHTIEAAELGDICGKRVLHLQCHIGRDTLCLVRRGAVATGLDFSGAALEVARSLAEETGLEANFVQGTVESAPQLTPGPFDLVFATWGTLCWLPDMRVWASVIASVLAPGGELYCADAHPGFYVLEEQAGRLVPTYDFQTPRDRPLEFDDRVTYTGDTTVMTHHSFCNWIHPLSATLGALIDVGLTIAMFHEHEVLPWRGVPSLVPASDRLWRLPDGHPRIPLSFSVRAKKAL